VEEGLNDLEPLEAGAEVTPEERQRIARGADELDLVNSGLEETMVNAYETIRQTLLVTPGVTDLRTAAFVSVINKIAVSYMELGIFP
jgi:glutamate dehydrogenase (NAD(P)+)